MQTCARARVYLSVVSADTGTRPRLVVVVRDLVVPRGNGAGDIYGVRGGQVQVLPEPAGVN